MFYNPGVNDPRNGPIVAAAHAYADSLGLSGSAWENAADDFIARNADTGNGGAGAGGGGTSDVAVVAHEVAKKVAQEQPGVSFKPADVVSVDATAISQYMTAHVHVDGDDAANTTQAVSLIGAVTVGARVMVVFVPPQGIYLIGTLIGECDEGEIVYSAFGVVTTTVSPPWGPPVDSVVFWIETFAGGAGSTDSTVTIKVDGIEQLAYTFGAGINHMDLYETDGADFMMFQHAPVTVQIAPGTDLMDCTVIIRYCKNRQGRNDDTAPTPPPT